MTAPRPHRTLILKALLGLPALLCTGLVAFSSAGEAAHVPPEISCPTPIIHSRRDEVASPRGASIIYNRLGTDDKKILWPENSNHIITRDDDSNLVNRFVEDCLNG